MSGAKEGFGQSPKADLDAVSKSEKPMEWNATRNQQQRSAHIRTTENKFRASFDFADNYSLSLDSAIVGDTKFKHPYRVDFFGPLVRTMAPS
jgi:hypothetical protein